MTATVTILLKPHLQIKGLKNFIAADILAEVSRFSNAHTLANDYYLAIGWTDNAGPIILPTSADKVETYKELLKFFDGKTKEPKLWVIFDHIDETIDTSASTYDDKVIPKTSVKSMSKIKLEKPFIKKEKPVVIKKEKMEIKKESIPQVSLIVFSVRGLC